MTVAYTWALQYWAEKVKPPVHPDYHPLVSVVELMQCVKKHITFYKWGILWSLGTQPTTTPVRGMEVNPAETQREPDSTPSLFGPPPKEDTPPVKLITLPTVGDVRQTPPGLADPPPEGMLKSFQPNPKGKHQKTFWLVRPLALLRWWFQ